MNIMTDEIFCMMLYVRGNWVGLERWTQFDCRLPNFFIGHNYVIHNQNAFLTSPLPAADNVKLIILS